MASSDYARAYEALDRIQELLGYQQLLAERAAAPDCPDAERALLQRDFAGLSEQIDLLADTFQAAASAALGSQLARLRRIMETRAQTGEGSKTPD